jgi:hypothetical protein
MFGFVVYCSFHHAREFLIPGGPPQSGAGGFVRDIRNWRMRMLAGKSCSRPMDIDQLIAHTRWCCSSVRLAELAGEPVIEADGHMLSLSQAESLVLGYTSIAEILLAQKNASTTP